MALSSMFLFSPLKVGKIPILSHIFQMGWNHQPVRGIYYPVVMGITISQYKEWKLKSENWKPHPLIERGTLRVLKSSIFCIMAKTYKSLFFSGALYIYIYMCVYLFVYLCNIYIY